MKFLKTNKLFIRMTNWEYWPMWLAYLPVIPIICFYALRMRKFFFFSNVNPQFKTGALLGASKYKILKQIPQKYLPKTIFISRKKAVLEDVLRQLKENKVSFPIVVKPDVGERGLLVAIIQNEDELSEYLKANDIDVILQEFVSLPNECGIFYYRKPSDPNGHVVSVGLKDFLKIKGDGVSTIRNLMLENPRYILQIDRFEKSCPAKLSTVLPKNETLILEPIGNHNRGTSFIDGNHLISKQLATLFDKINENMDEVYYGRFDLKYDTWEKLLQGEDIRILEMNGVASEPIHIYDQTVKIRDKYKSFYALWKTIYEISSIQRQRGIEPIKVGVALKAFLDYKKYVKSINTNWLLSRQL